MTNTADPLAGQSAIALGGNAASSGMVASAAREQTELQAMFTVMHSAGRDLVLAENNSLKECDRAEFADGACYSFKRGGSVIAGPGIKLARMLGRTHGGLAWDLRMVDSDLSHPNPEARFIHIRGVALDLLNVNRVAMEDRFKPMQQRIQQDGSTLWVEPDERDLRELVNRRGAICVRNALLQLIPGYVVDMCVARCRKTLEKKASGELKKDPERVAADLVRNFDNVMVSKAMLETRLGHPMKDVTPTEVTELREVFYSIFEGNSSVVEEFEVAEQEAPSAASEELAEKKAEREAALARESRENRGAAVAAAESASGKGEGKRTRKRAKGKSGDDSPAQAAAAAPEPAPEADPDPEEDEPEGTGPAEGAEDDDSASAAAAEDNGEGEGEDAGDTSKDDLFGPKGSAGDGEDTGEEDTTALRKEIARLEKLNGLTPKKRKVPREQFAGDAVLGKCDLEGLTSYRDMLQESLDGEDDGDD